MFYLSEFDNDYATPDETVIGDYIHAKNLANGYVAAVYVLLHEGSETFTLKLGTGEGCSVINVVPAFEQARGRLVAFQFARPRTGDVTQCYANPTLAKQVLGCSATHSLSDICTDALRW